MTNENRDVAGRVDVLVLAVKPQMMQAVCEDLRDLIADRQPLVISIAAGVAILLVPRLLNYIVAIYLIAVGVLDMLGM